MWCFFFSSRRRHTRCALVTGVQTCALPIFGGAQFGEIDRVAADAVQRRRHIRQRWRQCKTGGMFGAWQLRGLAGLRRWIEVGDLAWRERITHVEDANAGVEEAAGKRRRIVQAIHRAVMRSEERRVGKEGVSPCKYRWAT